MAAYPSHFSAFVAQGRFRGMKTSSAATLNARCRFGEETFAGTSANGRDAPKAVVKLGSNGIPHSRPEADNR